MTTQTKKQKETNKLTLLKAEVRLKEEVESIVLAQPVQFHGQMRTYFNATDGFLMVRNQCGNFDISHPSVANRFIEISFTNISCVKWKT